MRAILILSIGSWALATNVLAGDESAEAEQVATTYLKALTGAGDEGGKQLLLGGATMDAQLFSLENGEIVERDPVRKETGELRDAKKKMAELDGAGMKAFAKMARGAKVGDDLTAIEISAEQAKKLLAPTQARAKAFLKTHPVLAYVARVGKEVYWHPKNPVRPLLARSGDEGKYDMTVYRYMVESKEGPSQSVRRWPLRVIRFKTDAVDSGWKVLPASNWSVE